VRVSALEVPVRVSAPLVPVRVSAPLVPVRMPPLPPVINVTSIIPVAVSPSASVSV